MQDSKKAEGLLIADKLLNILSKYKVPTDSVGGRKIGDEILNLFDSEISKAKKEAAEKILGIVFQEFGILSIDEKLGTVKIVLDVEKSLLSATGIDIDKLSNKRE